MAARPCRSSPGHALWDAPIRVRPIASVRRVAPPGETAAAVLGVSRFGRPGSSSRNCDVLIEPTPEISQLGKLGISGISTRYEEVGEEKIFLVVRSVLGVLQGL